ncbi:hypothetical protein BO79DRAFT_246540 [Aspergillus costaricaensis CBS 115574]|uniref:Uncharacterized protein n=1 Tax=Aspergillus costaricaensis CBS 115574 TaxID=1448317 RepID=A0ACD1I9E5_9EURO|nr:hypothetical protein BO79DRAFT_246540 [Aspergillus costaricaensis CBS 115574]RAK86893.1 hypothetical protein BO79DRAFT_246540 [Aspergillus costaricaensis CBS 115574]
MSQRALYNGRRRQRQQKQQQQQQQGYLRRPSGTGVSTWLINNATIAGPRQDQTNDTGPPATMGANNPRLESRVPSRRSRIPTSTSQTKMTLSDGAHGSPREEIG